MAREIARYDREENPLISEEDRLIVLALKQYAWGKRRGKWVGFPKSLIKRLTGGLTPPQQRYWHEHSAVLGLLLQDRVMAKAFEAKDPRDVKLGLDAALDYKDRIMGKPTERVQVAQAVRIEVGGIDLNALPGERIPPPDTGSESE